MRKLGVYNKPRKYSDIPGHASALQIRELLPNGIFSNYFKFSFVRNPWDWQVSLYHFAQQKDTHFQNESIKQMSFSDYLNWRVTSDLKLQKDFLTDESDNLLVDFVGKMESIEKDFQTVCERLDINISLPHKNTSVHKPYQEYYDKKLKNLVAEHFRPDIEMFGYTFD